MYKTFLTLLALLLIAPLASAAHSISITNADEARPGEYTIRVDVDKFALVDFAGKDAKKGEGHIHYLVNGEDACTAGKAACSAPTDYATASTTFTFQDLEAGDKIEVVLVLSDHTNSGTDSSGNLNGGKVADSVTVQSSSSMGIPGFEIAALAAVLGAALLIMRRK